MKKLLPLLLILLTLAACALAEDPALPVFEWERDPLTHWQLDENGAPVNQGGHTLGDMMTCTVCGCEVWDWGDGTVIINDCDEYYNVLRCTVYEAGEMTSELTYALVCDETGMVQTQIEYIDGVLACRYEYDENGNCVHYIAYDEEGAPSSETFTDYAQDADGWYYACRTATTFATGESFLEECNQYGDTTLNRIIDADGTLLFDTTYEYGYEYNKKLWCKTYDDSGMLTAEDFYNEEGLITRSIDYNSNGERTEILNNEYGDPISVVSYTADGSVLSELIFAYVYAETGEQLEARIFTDGLLTEEGLYRYDEEGNYTGSQATTWLPDGGRIVREYNYFQDLLRQTEYAPDGTVLSDETFDPDNPWAW